MRTQKIRKDYNRLMLTYYKPCLKIIRILKAVSYILLLGVVILCITNFDNQEKMLKPQEHKLEMPKTLAHKESEKLQQIRINWNNITQINIEKSRVGPGEQGEPADYSNIPKDLYDKLYNENAYNGALSDIISLHRSVKDFRSPDCSQMLYNKYLPTASVIIIFHEEHLSVLLRNVWSVLNRSPEHLIKEVLLVDDGSSKEMLQGELDHYVKNYLSKVKVIRVKPRSGLIVARMAGAKQAKGDVLIFLDSHCEVGINWLPPLLDEVSKDYRTVVCPMIDQINQHDFHFISLDGGRGGFDWNLDWRIFWKLNEFSYNYSKPYENPVMAGGLFGISSKFFWELGGYDEGLYIWGGEQFEISFKVWMCGGRILDIQCSRVGHLYRTYSVFKPPPKNVDYLCMNQRRVAEVWMDEYKQYYYMRRPECAKVPYGDISDRLELKKKLKCKPFKWFLEEVAYEVTIRHPVIDPPNVAYGKIKNQAYTDFCVEIDYVEAHLGVCSSKDFHDIGISWRGEIKQTDSKFCLELGKSENGSTTLITDFCHCSTGQQLWLYDEKLQTITNGESKECLDVNVHSMKLVTKPCVVGEKSQQWTIEHFNKTKQDQIQNYIKMLRLDGKPKI